MVNNSMWIEDHLRQIFKTLFNAYLFSISQELRAAFENEAQTSLRPRLLLTAAIAAGSKTIDAAYEVSKINE